MMVTKIGSTTLEAIQVQRQRNIRQLARCHKQIRRNERYLKWFGWMWFPKVMVTPLHEELLESTRNLEEVDTELDEWLGPR
jgi:hypothetical protein